MGVKQGEASYAGRDTNEGTIATFISRPDGALAILLSYGDRPCRLTRQFTGFAGDLAIIAESNPADAEELKAAKLGDDR